MFVTFQPFFRLKRKKKTLNHSTTYKKPKWGT